MKIQYVGHSQTTSIIKPIGAGRLKNQGKYHFKKGEILEMPDDDAQKLLDNDAEYLKPNEVSMAQAKELGTPRLIQLEDGRYRRQRGFIKVEEKEPMNFEMKEVESEKEEKVEKKAGSGLLKKFKSKE